MWLKKSFAFAMLLSLVGVSALAGQTGSGSGSIGEDAKVSAGINEPTTAVKETEASPGSDMAKSQAPERSNEEELYELNAFLSSDFIRTSVWPGLGPFRNTAKENHLIDPSSNQLTFTTVGKRINSCQLEVHGGSNEAQCMLNLQMSVDFLLESLGVKPGAIHIVNAAASKNIKALTGNNYNPVQANIAPLIVSLQNLGVNEGSDNSMYRIVVFNKNLSSNSVADMNKNGDIAVANGPAAQKSQTKIAMVQEDKITAKSTKPTESVEMTVNANDQQSTPQTKPDAPTKQWFQVEKTGQPESKVQVIKGTEITEQSTALSNPDESKIENVVNTKSNTAEEPGATEGAMPPKVLSKDEQLKKDFQDVIQNWQLLKKTAVKDRKTNLLTSALAGKALIRQSDAIKWLAGNHKYYDMTPGGAKIEKVNALVPGKKYAVYAEVKEKTKYLDDSTDQVLKATDDTYKVNYTIEKIGEHWLITDSALVKTSTEKQGQGKVATGKSVPAKSTKALTRAAAKTAH